MGSKPVRRKFLWALGGAICLTLLSFRQSNIPSAKADLPWQMSEYFELDGGLNDGADQTVVKGNEASDLQNVVFTVSGAVKRRDGFTRLNNAVLSTGAVLTGVAQYTQTDGTRFLVSTAVNSGTTTGSIYVMPYGGGTTGPNGIWSEVTGSSPFYATQNSLADFAVASGSIIIEDGYGSTPPIIYSGSGNATVLAGSPPNATMVEYHKNILWLAGDAANPSRLTFSNISDISTYTNTDFLSINTNDGQQIRSIRSALDCLYVFKDASIWRVCGADRDNLIQEQMVQGYGTLSNNSVQLVQNIFYFVTQRGEVAAYDGGINVRIISTNITGTLKSIDLNRIGQTVSASFNDGNGIDNYYVAVSSQGSGTNDLLLQYHPVYKAWTKHRGMNINAMGTYEIGSVKPGLLFGDYVGRANQYPNGNSDDGASISSYYQSAQFHYPEMPHEKVFRLARIFLNENDASNVTFQTRVNFASATSGTISLSGTGSLWDTALWDTGVFSDGNAVIGRVEINQIGDFFQWRLSDIGTGNPFTLRGVQVWVEPTERIGGID